MIDRIIYIEPNPVYDIFTLDPVNWRFWIPFWLFIAVLVWLTPSGTAKECDQS